MNKQTADCQTTLRQSKIKETENGQAITIENKNKMEYVVTRFDGCVVTNTLAADYVITRRDIGDLIVELKGRSVDHAYKQIRATAEYWTVGKYRCGLMAAVIVCRQCPKSSTKRQRAEAEFKKICGGPLHIINGKNMVHFDDMFKFGRASR